MKEYKILLWGAGTQYNHRMNLLKRMEQNGDFKIVGITATTIYNINTLDGWQVIKKENIKNIEFDYMVLMSTGCIPDIMATAIRAGVRKDQIILCTVFDIPGFSFEEYIRLKTSNISIISPNCWGGMTANMLSMECNSPFKNLWIEEKDYLKVLKNLKHYVDCIPEFVYYETTDVEYPVCRLDDVLLHCNHYQSAEEVIDAWLRRRKKLNYNNLFVEMWTEDISVAEEFSKLNNYSKKICFVPWETNEKALFTILPFPQGDRRFNVTVLENGKWDTCSLNYNPIRLLNGMKEYRCE